MLLGDSKQRHLRNPAATLSHGLPDIKTGSTRIYREIQQDHQWEYTLRYSNKVMENHKGINYRLLFRFLETNILGIDQWAYLSIKKW